MTRLRWGYGANVSDDPTTVMICLANCLSPCDAPLRFDQVAIPVRVAYFVQCLPDNIVTVDVSPIGQSEDIEAYPAVG